MRGPDLLADLLARMAAIAVTCSSSARRTMIARGTRLPQSHEDREARLDVDGRRYAAGPLCAPTHRLRIRAQRAREFLRGFVPSWHRSSPQLSLSGCAVRSPIR